MTIKDKNYMNRLEEFSIEEIQCMHWGGILGILANLKMVLKGLTLYQSTIYNIEEFDIETMNKFISCLQQVVDAKQKKQ